MTFRSTPAFVLPSLALIACLGQSASASSKPAADAPADFKMIDKHPANLVRIAPDADWSSYKVVKLQPSTYEPSDPRHGLKPSDVAKVTATFDASLHTNLSGLTEGDGTALEIRPVITDIQRTNSLVNLASFIALRGLVVSYGAASVRYEICDAASGKKVGEITSRRHARPWNVMPWNIFQNFEALGQSSVILKSDAKNLHKDLNKLAQLPAAPKAQTTSTNP